MIKRTIALLAAFTLVALPSWAGNPPPATTINPFYLAQAEQNYQASLVQSVTMTEHDSFSVSGSTAHLTGKGAGSFDSGVNVVPNGTALDVTFANTDDPVFKQCQDGLAADPAQRSVITISGHGFYHVVVQNGVVSQAVVTLQSLDECSVTLR